MYGKSQLKFLQNANKLCLFVPKSGISWEHFSKRNDERGLNKVNKMLECGENEANCQGNFAKSLSKDVELCAYAHFMQGH